MHERGFDARMKVAARTQLKRSLERADEARAAVGIAAAVLLHHADENRVAALLLGERGGDAQKHAVAKGHIGARQIRKHALAALR